MEFTGREKEKTIFAVHFRAFYLEHAGDLIFFARKFVDIHTAEDIVHDLFVQLWDKRSTVIVEKNIRGYLLSMVQHACYDHLKHQRVKDAFMEKTTQQLKIEELTYFDTSSEDLWTKDKMETIYESIEQLPDRSKNVFKMAYLEGKKHSDIAERMKISVRTVETHVYKALKILRESLLFLFFI